MRCVNSFLPWKRAQGSESYTCSDHDMRAGLDLERMADAATKNALQVWPIRTNASLKRQEQECRQLPPSQQDKYMQGIGVNSFEAGLTCPGMELFGSPVDFAHCEALGNLPKHYLGMMFVFITKWKLFTLAELNDAVRCYPWPRGTVIQALPESSVKGATDGHSRATGLANSDVSYVGMRAHDMIIFAIHSVALLEPLVPEQHRSSVHWKCWCAHVKYFLMLMQRDASPTSVRQLDIAIREKQEIYLQIEEYWDLWCPNNHYAQHFPLDILLWGPVFLTSALRFEAANQVVIQAGRATNFKSLLKSTAEKVALRRALELKKDPNDRHSIQIRERLTETVHRGTSSTIDVMWAGGWLPLHSESVKVVWVASIEYAHYRIDVHAWLRLVVEETESLAKIDDLFQVGGILYALFSFYPGALQQDAATGQLFASFSSIGPDVQFPGRQRTIRRFDHIPDLLLLHRDHGRQCFLFFPW